MVNFHHDICFILGLISILLFYFLTVINVLCLKKTTVSNQTNFNVLDTEKTLSKTYINRDTFLFNHNKKRFRYQSHESTLEVL
jgi:hypothetical protein